MASDNIYSITSVVCLAKAVRVCWADGHTSVFHPLWLRDNCACAHCGDHASGIRLQSLLDIPFDIIPSHITSDGSFMQITWANDGHQSRFAARWLRDHCFTAVPSLFAPETKILWDHTLKDLPAVDYCQLQETPCELLRLFTNVATYGFVLVRNMGTVYDEIERLTTLMGYVRNTHFGLVTDLKPRVAGAHLSDLSAQILPHTDETYRAVPTGINIFHCIQPSNEGGGISMLVDAHRSATLLRQEDEAAFNLLCKVPIRHERRADREIIQSKHPAFTIDTTGNIVEVRLNERTMSALALPFELIEPVYNALHKLLRIAYDPVNRIQYRLAGGEALVFDNLRVLHGRTAFTGPRLVRQSNVMRDEFYARMSYLDEQLY